MTPVSSIPASLHSKDAAGRPEAHRQQLTPVKARHRGRLAMPRQADRTGAEQPDAERQSRDLVVDERWRSFRWSFPLLGGVERPRPSDLRPAPPAGVVSACPGGHTWWYRRSIACPAQVVDAELTRGGGYLGASSMVPLRQWLPVGVEVGRWVLGSVDLLAAVGAHGVDLEVPVPVGRERELAAVW